MFEPFDLWPLQLFVANELKLAHVEHMTLSQLPFRLFLMPVDRLFDADYRNLREAPVAWANHLAGDAHV